MQQCINNNKNAATNSIINSPINVVVNCMDSCKQACAIPHRSNPTLSERLQCQRQLVLCLPTLDCTWMRSHSNLGDPRRESLTVAVVSCMTIQRVPALLPSNRLPKQVAFLQLSVSLRACHCPFMAFYLLLEVACVHACIQQSSKLPSTADRVDNPTKLLPAYGN